MSALNPIQLKLYYSNDNWSTSSNMTFTATDYDLRYKGETIKRVTLMKEIEIRQTRVKRLFLSFDIDMNEIDPDSGNDPSFTKWKWLQEFDAAGSKRVSTLGASIRGRADLASDPNTENLVEDRDANLDPSNGTHQATFYLKSAKVV